MLTSGQPTDEKNEQNIIKSPVLTPNSSPSNVNDNNKEQDDSQKSNSQKSEEFKDNVQNIMNNNDNNQAMDMHPWQSQPSSEHEIDKELSNEVDQKPPVLSLKTAISSGNAAVLSELIKDKTNNIFEKVECNENVFDGLANIGDDKKVTHVLDIIWEHLFSEYQQRKLNKDFDESAWKNNLADQVSQVKGTVGQKLKLKHMGFLMNIHADSLDNNFVGKEESPPLHFQNQNLNQLFYPEKTQPKKKQKIDLDFKKQ